MDGRDQLRSVHNQWSKHAASSQGKPRAPARPGRLLQAKRARGAGPGRRRLDIRVGGWLRKARHGSSACGATHAPPPRNSVAQLLALKSAPSWRSDKIIHIRCGGGGVVFVLDGSVRLPWGEEGVMGRRCGRLQGRAAIRGVRGRAAAPIRRHNQVGARLPTLAVQLLSRLLTACTCACLWPSTFRLSADGTKTGPERPKSAPHSAVRAPEVVVA